MNSEFSSTDIIFDMTWRTLSHAAVPAMLPATSLDANGLIPRAFCPQVYDGVRKTVTDMREEGQFAAWYWVIPPSQDDGEKEKESVGWHPCFMLPANRRIVTRNVNPNIITSLEPLTHRRRSTSASTNSHIRRSSGDSTRRLSSVREENKCDDSTGDAVNVRARASSSLHVRPLMVRK